MPESYRDLMLSPNSPVIDFYPVEFELDSEGKHSSWEAIVILPFIDEVRYIYHFVLHHTLLD